MEGEAIGVGGPGTARWRPAEDGWRTGAGEEDEGEENCPNHLLTSDPYQSCEHLNTLRTLAHTRAHTHTHTHAHTQPVHPTTHLVMTL